jgi:acetylornithine deacetylase/succinyl-diaminopimelate desuccinylase-like protein
MSQINNFISTNKNRFLSELFELIRIPSVSAKAEHKNYMAEATTYLKEILLLAGLDQAEIMQTKGHSVVFGQKIINENYPTILIYGHYDVQPPEPLELWNTPPFEPTIIDGKIYARGADDDKGQLFIQIKAFETLNKCGLLKCNVKFLIEGEEEIGSVHLKEFCEKNKEILKCDLILVSDTNMIAPDVPTVTVGLRGLAYFQVEVTGSNRDLHSGIFGGAVANPINVLAQMIAKLTDENNRITIPGFYNNVMDLSDFERDMINKAPFNDEEYCKSLGINDTHGEKGYTTIEKTGIRPSIDVNGIWGGYIGEGAKTVLPSKAFAKISFRLVPNQNPTDIEGLFTKYMQSIAPNGVTINVTYLHGGFPYSSSLNSKEYKAAVAAFEITFGKKPIPARTGGSIPVIATFEEVLGVKSLLLGFGLESDAIHSPNENFPISNFFKGIETICEFYLKYQDS